MVAYQTTMNDPFGLRASEERERAEAAASHRENVQALAEGRVSTFNASTGFYEPKMPPGETAPTNILYDERYWAFHQLQVDHGNTHLEAHRSAINRAKQEAWMRAKGHADFGIDKPSGPAQRSHTPRQPRNDNNKKSAMLDIVCAADLAGKPIPPRVFFVPDFVPKGKVTLLTGDGGTGKSLLGLMLAASSAMGETWLDLPVHEGAALVLSAEDDLDEVHRRLASIVGRDRLARLDRLHIAPLVGLDPILGAPDRATGRMAETDLFQDLKRQLRRLKPDLLVLDTLADLFGGDEVKRDQARGFIAMLNRLTAEFGTTIVLLSHPSQSGMESGRGTSGSTGWSNSVRSRMYLRHCEDADMRVLELMKTNSNRPGLKIQMRWQEGRFDRVDECRQQADDLGEAKSEFLRLLEEFTRQGRAVSHNPSPSYAPKLFSDEPGVRIAKQKFKDAMAVLLRDQQVLIEPFGPPSRQRSRLAIAGSEAVAEPDTSNSEAAE